MTTLSLRVTNADAELFKKYAQANGLSLTDFIRQTLIEKIEDEHDLDELRQAMAEPNQQFYTFDEMDKELGF